jgi:hypothetical protein
VSFGLTKSCLTASGAADLDVRDLEAALVRLSPARDHHIGECPGGSRCFALLPART